jgi:hypothetical protein
MHRNANKRGGTTTKSILPGVSPGEDGAKRRGFKKNPGLEKPAPILRELAYYNRE